MRHLLTVFLATFLWGPQAAATSTLSSELPREHWELEYIAPSSCPSREAFVADVRSLIEDPNSGNVALQASVRTLQRANGKFQLTLDLPSGSRSLEGVSCQDVTRAAALLVALFLEDPRMDRPSEPSSAPQEPLTAPRRSRRLAASFEAGVDTATLVTPALLLQGRFSLHFRYLSVGLSFVATPSVTQVIDMTRTLTTGLVGGGAVLCLRPWEFRYVATDLCTKLDVSALWAHADGVQNPSHAAPMLVQSVWLAEVVVGPRWRLSPFFSGGWALALRRPVIILDGPGDPLEAHRAGPALRASAGLVIHF